jgi:cytochrome c556
MKALKITLMLAVFCLTVSGSTYESSTDTVNQTMKKINKDEFRMAGPVKDKINLPGNRI